MKKNSLIFLLSWVGIISLSAQDVKMVPQLGGNMIPMKTTDLSPKYGVGLHTGFDVQLQLKNNFWLTSGLHLSQKQQFEQKEEIVSFSEMFGGLLQLIGQGDNPFDSIAESLGVNLDSRTTTRTIAKQYNLELPVIATYKVKKWNFYGGGYAGMVLAARTHIETQTETPFLKVVDVASFDSTGLLQFILPDAEETSTEVSSNTDHLVKLDAGMIVGAGYQDERWSFNLYYAHGLLDYRSAPSGDTRVHRSFRATLGYVINVRKEESKIILE